MRGPQTPDSGPRRSAWSTTRRIISDCESTTAPVQHDGHLRLDRVLDVDRLAHATEVARWLADVQRRADLRALDSEPVVILTIHQFGESQVVLEHSQCLTRDERDCE